jgi:hypothetical protein
MALRRRSDLQMAADWTLIYFATHAVRRSLPVPIAIGKDTTPLDAPSRLRFRLALLDQVALLDPDAVPSVLLAGALLQENAARDGHLGPVAVEGKAGDRARVLGPLLEALFAASARSATRTGKTSATHAARSHRETEPSPPPVTKVPCLRPGLDQATRAKEDSHWVKRNGIDWEDGVHAVDDRSMALCESLLPDTYEGHGATHLEGVLPRLDHLVRVKEVDRDPPLNAARDVRVAGGVDAQAAGHELERALLGLDGVDLPAGVGGLLHAALELAEVEDGDVAEGAGDDYMVVVGVEGEGLVGQLGPEVVVGRGRARVKQAQA